MQGSSRPDRELLDGAALWGHLLAPGSVPAFLAGHRRELFPDEMFADLFSSGRGRLSVPAEVIAVVVVLQGLEGLSDRQAVRRLETDITWKAAAGLSLADGAFDHTVLVLWRNKLRVPGGFTIDEFEIPADRPTMTCPAGVTVEIRGRNATFGPRCVDCRLRALCTTAVDGRAISLHPDHDLLAAARRQAATTEFDEVYRNKRPMVERSLAWLTRATNRRLRFRGIERNRLGWAHRCAAINLQRLPTLGPAVRPDRRWAIA